MAKLLSATDARDIADLAKTRLAEEKRLAHKAEEDQKNYLQLVQDGWDQQMKTMIAAAVKGTQSVNLTHPLYLFSELIQLGFQVYEVGWVKNQEVVDLNNVPNKNEIHVRANWLTSLRAGIQELFDAFMIRSQADVSPYYGGSNRYQAKMLKALNESFLEGEAVFDGDHTMWVDVPERVREKYRSHFGHISNAIRYYKRASADPSYKIPQKSIVELPEFVFGEYQFGREDKAQDILVPENKSTRIGGKANFFKVKWKIKSKSKGEFLQEPLFSCPGLAWISNEDGQTLIKSVFFTLQRASERGDSKVVLVIEKTKESWHFVNHLECRIPSCSPEDINQLLNLAGYKIANANSGPSKFNIHVAW